jgi:hypothetical protein
MSRRAEVYARRLIARNVRPTITAPATTAQVEEFLAQPAANPPTFRDLAAEFGWQYAADRINRWAANDYEGDYTDARYAPQPHGGSA